MRMLGNESYSSMNRLVPGSSPGRTAKNVMAVVSWWWNHLKNLRRVAQSGRALDLGSRGFPGSNPGTPIHLWVCQVTLKATYLL